MSRGNMPKGFVYALGPIDWWLGWCPFTTLIRAFESDPVSLDLDRVFNLVVTAAWGFTRAGWEGDGRWYLSAVPNDEGGPECDLLLAVKQSNNGSTFVFSEHELPWLREYEEHMPRRDDWVTTHPWTPKR